MPAAVRETNIGRARAAGSSTVITNCILILFFSFPVFAFENCSSLNLKELESCSLKNVKEEDAKLNYLYGEIMSTYPDIKRDVINTQRLWIKARDSICSYSEDDGAEYHVYKNSCLYEQTVERNRELRLIITKKNGLSYDGSNKAWGDYLMSHCVFMQGKYADKGCEERNKRLHQSQ